MKAIHQLIVYFQERGRLSAQQLDYLVAKGYWGEYTRAELQSLAARIGESFFFHVTGEVSGPLWGTDTYTSDSDLGVACVHAGVLEPGESGLVKVIMVQPLAVFRGSTRNEVTSQNWTTRWAGAYQVEAVRK